MRVLIAPDKFKGTLTARQAAEAIARGWGRARPADELTLLPISDGGDGFGAVMGAALEAKSQRVTTIDAAHRVLTATWWWQAKRQIAIIESANIIGLAMLPAGRFHPFQLDTFGLGAVVRAARRKGARRLIIGIGGSATNDGGFGLARALGWRFFGHAGEKIEHWTELGTLHSVCPPAVSWPRNFITVAVDVQNVLLGRRGATRIYGPQKGIRSHEIIPAERCLRRLAQVLKRQCGLDFAASPGAGAAGGLGFGLASFVNADFALGFELFARQTGLGRLLKKVDMIVTGEGALDRSTLMGKGVGQLAQLAQARKLPVIGLAGISRDQRALGKWFQTTCAMTTLTSAVAARRRPELWLERLAFQAAQNLAA